MSDAIFQSTGQALHTAFLIAHQEPRQGGPLRRALIQILEQQEVLTKRQREWMDQLIGEGGGTVNFSGLTSDEIRGQCALIVQSVNDHLPDPEKFAIWARFAYQMQKAQGVAGLATYVRPLIRITDETAIRALVYGHVSPGQRLKGLSYSEISQERKVPVITLRRAAALISSTVKSLEALAIQRLTPMFERDRLVAKCDCADMR